MATNLSQNADSVIDEVMNEKDKKEGGGALDASAFDITQQGDDKKESPIKANPLADGIPKAPEKVIEIQPTKFASIADKLKEAAAKKEKVAA